MTNGDATVLWRVDNLERKTDKLDETKADSKDLEQVLAEIRGIRAIANRVLMALVVASITFAFAAIQFTH